MIDANQASIEILEFFRKWEGYGPIAAAMANNPEIDFFVAGGVVRDAFFGRLLKAKDIDIFLQGPGCVAAVGALAQHGSLETGSFGAYEWTPNATSAVDCDIILVHKFFNGLWRCENMLDALNQFDCTVNALAVNLRTGDLMNPQNGRRDISTKTMRAVRFDYPNEPIVPDAILTRNSVLWWRLLHYAYLLDLEIEPVTRNWLVRHRDCESHRAEFEQTFHRIEDQALLPLNSCEQS